MNAYELFLKSSGITIDSRQIRKGQLFLALKGPNFNGNSYVEEALNKGAMGAIVDEKSAVLGDNCVLVGKCIAMPTRYGHDAPGENEYSGHRALLGRTEKLRLKNFFKEA